MATWHDYASASMANIKKAYPMNGSQNSTLIGAGIGSVGGAILAALASDRKKRLKNAILGALAGAGVGGVSGYMINGQSEIYDRLHENSWDLASIKGDLSGSHPFKTRLQHIEDVLKSKDPYGIGRTRFDDVLDEIRKLNKDKGK